MAEAQVATRETPLVRGPEVIYKGREPAGLVAKARELFHSLMATARDRTDWPLIPPPGLENYNDLLEKSARR